MILRLSFIIFFLNASSLAQTAEEIITKAENAIKGKTAIGFVSMTVKTPDYERTLKMENWWIGNEKALIVIKSPKKEAGNKTLKIGNEMWNYLRNTGTTIKIPPSMMLQSWNGSDFTNDDLVRESNLNEDYFIRLIGSEAVEGNNCWKIELTPKPDAPVVWGKLEYWVSKQEILPVRVNYYDENSKLVRHMLFSENKKFSGRIIPSRWMMINDLKKDHITSFILEDMAFDVVISDNIFSFRELERGD